MPTLARAFLIWCYTYYMESGKNKPNFGEDPGAPWVINGEKSATEKNDEEKKRAEEEAKKEAKEKEKKKAEADKKSAAEEKKKDEATEKSAEEEEEKNEREEHDEKEEHERKLARLRQSIMGVTAVGIVTQSLQRLWRLLTRRRKLEITEDGRILATDDDNNRVDLGDVVYATEAEQEQTSAQIPNAPTPIDVLPDQLMQSDQTLDAEIPSTEELPDDETLQNMDFIADYLNGISGETPGSSPDTLPTNQEPGNVLPARPESTEEKPRKPWRLFGDNESRPSNRDQSKPTEAKQPNQRQTAARETSLPNAEPSTISDTKAQEIAEKLLKRLNSQEVEILRGTSPSRGFMARLVQEKLDTKVDLKASDLDRLNRLLRENLRKPDEKTPMSAKAPSGGGFAGDSSVGGAPTTPDGSSIGSSSVNGPSVATPDFGPGVASNNDTGFGSTQGSTAGDSSVQTDRGELSGAHRSESDRDNEVDWSSLLPGESVDNSLASSIAAANHERAKTGSAAPYSSPSYQPEFGKSDPSSQGSSSLPRQSSASSPSAAGSAGQSFAQPAESLAASNLAANDSAARRDRPSSGGFSSPVRGSAGPSTSTSSPLTSDTGANRAENRGGSTGRSSYSSPDFSGLATLLGGLGQMGWSIGQGLSRSGQRRAENLSNQILPRLPSRSLSNKTEQRAAARDVGLLNAMRELYLLAVTAGVVQPNENLLQIDAREVNETHDVRDDTMHNRMSPVVQDDSDDAKPVQDDDDDQNDTSDNVKDGTTFDVAAFLAALIVLASFRDARSVTADEESMRPLEKIDR